jgi:Mu-like prophage I protein
VTIRFHSFAVPVDDPLVERPAPGAAPTAFRIWAAGSNWADDGEIFFTRKSAELLMAEQDARGRLYPSDFDHKSVLPGSGATDGRASGWHRLGIRLDAQGEPELWAEGLDWCDDARAGLEATPPLWRYFSPAFKEVDGEVVSYINFALTINPATHMLPALATIGASHREVMTMTKKELMAAYAKVCAADTSEEERAEAMRAIGSHIDALPTEGEGVGNESGEQPNPPHVEGAPPEPYGGQGTGGGAGGPPAERSSSAGGAADPGNEWPSNEGRPGPGAERTERQATVRAASVAVAGASAAGGAGDRAHAATVQVARDLDGAHSRIDELEINTLLAAHPDLGESLRAWCLTQPPKVVKGFLSARPRMSGVRQQTTVRGDDPARPLGLVGSDLAWLNAQMGIQSGTRSQFENVPVAEGGGLRIHTMRPSTMRTATAGRSPTPGAAREGGGQ